MTVIRQVWKNNANDQLLLSVPKDNDEDIEEGDYVFLKKVEEPEMEEKE